MELLRFVASELGITTPMVLASDFHIQSTATQKLTDLVKSVRGTTYLTGQGSKDYLDESVFRRENSDDSLLADKSKT